MPLAGKHLLPREIAALGHDAYWTDDVHLTKMVATALGESAGYVGANHLNGTPPTSEDCGLMQINIAGPEIGGPVEAALMTNSHDPAIWTPVAEANVARAARLYAERHWQPWVAYTTGWATFPEWWVWHQNAQGKPIGPWLQTGRYIQRALIGVANYHLVIAKDLTPLKGLELARSLATHFGVKGEIKTTGLLDERIVGWSEIPVRPVAPPLDGFGPRPTENSGR